MYQKFMLASNRLQYLHRYEEVDGLGEMENEEEDGGTETGGTETEGMEAGGMET